MKRTLFLLSTLLTTLIGHSSELFKLVPPLVSIKGHAIATSYRSRAMSAHSPSYSTINWANKINPFIGIALCEQQTKNTQKYSEHQREESIKQYDLSTHWTQCWLCRDDTQKEVWDDLRNIASNPQHPAYFEAALFLFKDKKNI